MENASKALIIIGSVLLALIALASLMFMWNSASDVSSTAQNEKALEQLTAFNKEFESYQKELLRGADIVSVINKIRNNNKAFDDAEFKIYWTIKMKDAFKVNGVTYLAANTEYKENSDNSYNNVSYNKIVAGSDYSHQTDVFKAFKRLYFKCIGVEYADTGRIKGLKFEELSQDYINSLFP